MRALRVIRWIAFAGIALLLVAIATFEFAPGIRERVLPPSGGNTFASAEDTMSVPAGLPIGGSFELTDEKGYRVTDADYRGCWMLVFFGYTNCPDECPLTLQKMAAAVKNLGPLAEKVAPLFVTVDPARDTPGTLANYLENFDIRIIGLTGTGAQISAVAKAYRVYYSPGQNEESGADLISYSTVLYLMKPTGELAALFPQHIGSDKLAAALRACVSAGAQSDERGNSE
jgi:protein SCO1/2